MRPAQRLELKLVRKTHLESWCIESYLQLVNVLEDAALVIKKEKAEESKKSEQSGQLYNILLSYVQKLKLSSALERNLI